MIPRMLSPLGVILDFPITANNRPSGFPNFPDHPQKDFDTAKTVDKRWPQSHLFPPTNYALKIHLLQRNTV